MWFWLFVVAGGLTLTAALCGGATAWQARRSRLLLVLHALAIVLLALAWFEGHGTAAGRAGLALAVAIELAVLLASRSKAVEPANGEAASDNRPVRAADDYFPQVAHRASAEPTASPQIDADVERETSLDEGFETGTSRTAAETQVQTAAARTDDVNELTVESGGSNFQEAVADEFKPGEPKEASVEEESPSDSPVAVVPDWEGEAPIETAEPPSVPRRLFSTIALFQRPCALTPTVFLASLRRAGQRDASLANSDDSEGKPEVRIGSISLRLHFAQGRCEAPELEPAAANTTSWNGAAAAYAEHAGHAILISEFDVETAPDTVVRVHHRAHAALTEFAAVAAVLWPSAERICPPDELAALAEHAGEEYRSVAATCTTVRHFELGGENEGLVLIDSLGLAAFGLPDVQLIVERTDEQGGDVALAILERLLEMRADDVSVEALMDDSEHWRLTWTRSAFAPDREVVQISRKTVV